MKIRVEPHPHFQRLYECLDACKKGFLAGCRPIIGVDECHLKGPFSGQLLAAVGIDANDNIYPIAYAAVELETEETYSWFLELWIGDLGHVSDHGWIFISDQQKGLDKAFDIVVPEAQHRWCVRHMYGNFKEKFKGKVFKDLLWSAVRASNRYEFEVEMNKLKDLNSGAYEWLMGKDLDKWARHRFSIAPKCDMLLTNMCETFNSYILDAQDKPILTMLEMIRCNLMKRLQRKREAMSKHDGVICSKIQKKLEQIKINSSRNCMATQARPYEFQVGDYLHDQHVIDIASKTCSCNRWDLNGIPCIHVVAAIYLYRVKPEDYVAECYHKATYLKAYEPIIHPVKGFNMWLKSTEIPLLPPIVRKQPGRPKRSRKKDIEMEKGVDANCTKLKRHGTLTCTKCWKKGHNKRNCSNQPQDPPPVVDVQSGSTVVACSAINVAVNMQSRQVVAPANAQRKKLPIKRRSNVNPPRTSCSKK
ncbi:PREDICTED: Transposase MuDR plant [Prunus dulcis]|uniref:PREDICTED: Transposase MuDR plant n=1 Tax=Prunus dulcis TaxID=3755 RepID=A0A5E4FK47_PRUDU|nr:PREDICTED: Transposase MuDR plant [Prunus dulcis]